MIGHFRAFKEPVQRERLRQSVNRIKMVRNDPPRRTIYRRKYRVKSPLSIFHIDGHHKLTRLNITK